MKVIIGRLHASKIGRWVRMAGISTDLRKRYKHATRPSLKDRSNNLLMSLAGKASSSLGI